MGHAPGPALPGERAPLPRRPPRARLTLLLPARAKLNLGLAVTGRLSDGRHAVETRLQAISLSDLLEVSAAPTLSLEVVGDAPGGEANLVLRAARALAAAAGRALPARIRLWKRVPAGAGLGGGSSDAAAALRALTRLHGLDVDLDPVAGALGSDVAFFLRGGTADATGPGDVLAPVRTAESWFAVAWPGWPVATGAVYDRFDSVGGEGWNHLYRAALDVEPRLADFARRLGAGWALTGSGSAFYRVADGPAEARAAVAGLGCWTAVARSVGRWS